MKKLFLFFALFAFAMSGAAQTTHMVQGIPRTDLKAPRQVNVQSEVTPDIDFNKINAWVGSGKNQAALAVKWHDGNGYTNVYVWGYRWQDGSVKTGADMIAQVAKEDPRFYYLVYGGTWSYTDSTCTDSIYTGDAIGGIGYSASATHDNIKLKLNNQYYNLTQGAVHTNTYNFDSWTTTATDGYWNSGWYENGYWSYWNAEDVESAYGYASIGCSGRTLSDGCVDGWVFAYDFDWNADMGGNIVYVSSLNGIDDNSNTIAPEKVKSRGDVAPTTYTVTSVEELVEAVQNSADGDIIQFDESLRGQELDWGERYSLDIEGKQLSILGNGVILKNSGGFSAINEGKVLVKDFIFDAPKAFVISMETGYMTVDNCTFKNYIHKNGSPLIRVFQTEIYPKKDYFITISNCLFENNSLLTENGKYKNNLIDLAGYRNAKHDFTATFVNNTFVGNKAGKGSCLTAGNYIDVVLVNNVFENNVCTKQGGTDILIDDGDPFLTSAYNVISGTINTEYQNALSSTDIWAEDLEASLELVDGKYYVREDTPAYLHLPANTEIEGVSFPETDIYGNTIDYSKDTNSGCSQLVYDASDVIDYTAGTFIVNEDWYGHQNSTINFLTDGGEWVYRVIQRENEGVQLGCTAQYGTIYGGKMYITSKQDKDPGAKVEGGRLTIADAKTMKVEKQFQTITANGYTGRADGRAFLGVNEHKGYMGTSNGIFILDLDTQEFTGYITTGDDEDLYTGQVGNMIRVNDYVFANHQSQGLLVINAETDEIERAILGPDDAKIGTFTLAKDGNLYLMTNKNLLCLDPISLEYSVVELPEGTKLTGEGWSAWTPSTLCASCQQNAIFWGAGSGFAGARKVLKYDIDTKECSTYFDLSDTDWTIYGCSFRIDPVTDEGVVSLFKSFGDPTYVTRKYDAAGEMVAEYAMESNYWFPSIPIFPDNAAPVVKGTETLSIAEDAHDVISLADFATDADNIDAAIVKSIKSISNRSVIAASIVNGDLIIVPLKKGTATVTIQANSNGLLAESDIIVEVTGTSGISTLEGGVAVSEGTYSLDGKIVGGSYRGVVIIKMSDGTTRKVIR
ncbi:MAG: DUF5074 domain-containing protein [Muribaculaceae bacterium]|nr:DUF5074 domain-containing protein [Muribaculaceae bacterium]